MIAICVNVGLNVKLGKIIVNPKAVTMTSIESPNRREMTTHHYIPKTGVTVTTFEIECDRYHFTKNKKKSVFLACRGYVMTYVYILRQVLSFTITFQS